MINIAICDDDVLFGSSVEKLLYNMAAEYGVEISCDVFTDGSALIRAFTEQQVCFDLIYLDIEMVHMNGIRTAKELRKLEQPVLIIYLSGHEEYLKALLATEPFRFLDKPIREMAFRAAFLDACERLRERAGYFTFSYKKTYYKVALNSIKYFESNKRIIAIHMTENGHEESDLQQDRFYGRMNDIEKKVASVNGRFLRIHQSYLVNYDFIQTFKSTEVVLLDGSRLQISEDRRKKVQDRLVALSGKERIKNG